MTLRSGVQIQIDTSFHGKSNYGELSEADQELIIVWRLAKARKNCKASLPVSA
jgi:hypothetical protein